MPVDRQVSEGDPNQDKTPYTMPCLPLSFKKQPPVPFRGMMEANKSTMHAISSISSNINQPFVEYVPEARLGLKRIKSL